MSDWLGTVGRLASASAAHCSAGCWHPPWLQVSPLREATTLPEQQQVVDRARVCNAGEEEVVVHTRGRTVGVVVGYATRERRHPPQWDCSTGIAIR